MNLRRKSKIRANVPTTSFGDIAFLLIIFFILTAAFMQESGVKLQLPRDKDIEEQGPSPVSVMVDQKGDVYIQGKKVPTKDVVQGRVQNLLQGKKDKKVLFRCDARLTRTVYEPIIIAITDAGGLLVPLGDKKE